VLTFLGISAVLCVIGGVLLRADAGRRAARDEADDLEAVRQRLVAAGEDVDAIDASSPVGGTVYRSAAVAIEPPVDARLAELVIDPTLTAVDVETAVEHVAPGVGSLTSFAATVEDTRMRTSAELRELHEAEEAAYAEAPAQDDRLFFADFNRRMEAAFTDFAVGTRRVARFASRFHGDEHYADCAHCAEALHEHSDEYAQIVADRESTDTGQFSEDEIRAILARA
jgi:hypothetical protein